MPSAKDRSGTKASSSVWDELPDLYPDSCLIDIKPLPSPIWIEEIFNGYTNRFKELVNEISKTGGDI